MNQIEAFLYDSDLSDLIDNKVISEEEIIKFNNLGDEDS